VRARESSQRSVGEDVTDESVVLHHCDLVVVEGRHAGGFLSTVLQRVESVVALVGHVGTRSHDADYAARFFQTFSVEGVVIERH
jgi:hypothetical protein